MCSRYVVSIFLFAIKQFWWSLMLFAWWPFKMQIVLCMSRFSKIIWLVWTYYALTPLIITFSTQNMLTIVYPTTFNTLLTSWTAKLVAHLPYKIYLARWISAYVLCRIMRQLYDAQKLVYCKKFDEPWGRAIAKALKVPCVNQQKKKCSNR
jgi:hypothetical protein